MPSPGARAAFVDGCRRVNSAPLLLLGMAAVTFVLALPLTIVLAGMLESHLGRSLAADTAVTGVDGDWWEEFSAQASGLGTTFVPSIIGFGAVLDNLGAIADNQPLAATIAGVTVAWLAIWSFLSGGVLDRYARQRPTRAVGFFAACGLHFWRFARLGVVGLAAYWLLFAGLHGWLFDGVYPMLTRQMTAERNAFAVRLACYAVFAAAMFYLNIVFDYARIRIVVEDRRSAVGAVSASVRFVQRHKGAFALYLLNTSAYIAVVLCYAVAATSAPRSGLRLGLTLLVGQIYLLARHYLKLLFYASELSYFQGALAHAAYTAAPAVVWPESPAAEAIQHADPATR